MVNINELTAKAESDVSDVFSRIASYEYENTKRVLDVFHEYQVSARHFNPSNGYGYDDASRDTLDLCFAKIMFCEKAVISPNIASGTHALYLALDALLRAGDRVIFASGQPYDTLKNALLQDTAFTKNDVSLEYIDLKADNTFDLPSIERALRNGRAGQTTVLYVQRSRGYAWRDSILPEDMKPLFDLAHGYKNVITFVDNCYGEFTLTVEPSLYGADVMAGSLIKNAGGGLAPTGGYVAGRKKFIDTVCERLTVPGMGREVGSYAASYRPFYQGLFMAPHVTAEALKSAVLFSRVFEILGKETMPRSSAVRSDIVQALRFDTADKLIAFCRAVQAASPVDGHVVPEPWDMPGYENQVIMAAGTFVQGASIELSADAPMREPFTAYIQGALTYMHGKIALETVLKAL